MGDFILTLKSTDVETEFSYWSFVTIFVGSFALLSFRMKFLAILMAVAVLARVTVAIPHEDEGNDEVAPSDGELGPLEMSMHQERSVDEEGEELEEREDEKDVSGLINSRKDRGGQLQNGGKNCWGPCRKKQGSCSWCGSGVCCRRKWHDTSNGCDGSIGGKGHHFCVLPKKGKTSKPVKLCGHGNKIALKSHHGKYVVAEKDGKANANRKHARSWETFTVEYLGGNKIALKSTHGKYLVAEKKYKEVNANRKHRKSWETFVVEKQKGGKIALKTAHGLYVVAEKDGRLRADRKKVGSWEKFVIECKGKPPKPVKLCKHGNKIALKSHHGKYVVAEKNGKANANRKYARSWETFTVEYLGGNKIALKSTHGKYLVAEKNYGKEVNANRKHRKSWETFVVEKQKGGKIALKTAHGLYVVAEKDGRLRADRKKVGSWERFIVECKGKKPVNYRWGSWRKWSKCSKRCGVGGTQTRKRFCIRPKFGGKKCPSKVQTKTKKCSIKPCPVHCQWNKWRYGKCSKTCGTGARTNTRTKLVTEAYGGTCTGQPTEIEMCNTKPCDPVHCKWGNWKFGKCSKTCGGGKQTCTRSIKVKAAHGGKKCYGSTRITRSCKIQECPVHCKWDEWKDGTCSKTCGVGTQTNTRNKMVKKSYGGKECSGSASITISCNIQECPDCRTMAYTNGKNPDANKACIFPFKYQGKEFKKCTTYLNNGVFWCATEVNSAGSYVPYSGKWGTCEEKCPKPDSSCRTMASTSSKNPDANKACIFPFKYQGKEFEKCTAYLNNGAFWCATEVNSAGSYVPYSGKWGTCEEKCPKSGHEHRKHKHHKHKHDHNH